MVGVADIVLIIAIIIVLFVTVLNWKIVKAVIVLFIFPRGAQKTSSTGNHGPQKRSLGYYIDMLFGSLMILIGLYGFFFPGDLYIESVGRNQGICNNFVWIGIGLSIILIGRVYYKPTGNPPPGSEEPSNK